MVEGGVSGYWVLTYVLIAFVTCVPLLIQRSQPSRPQLFSRFVPALLIVTCSITCALVTTSREDAFAHHVANCYFGMSGEAWLEEFADDHVQVYGAEPQSGRGRNITIESWEGDYSLCPSPGMGGSNFDFMNGLLWYAYVNID